MTFANESHSDTFRDMFDSKNIPGDSAKVFSIVQSAFNPLLEQGMTPNDVLEELAGALRAETSELR